MKMITGKTKISTGGQRGQAVKDFDVAYPEFTSLREAQLYLGRGEALRLLNLAVATDARLRVRHRVLTLTSGRGLGRLTKQLINLGVPQDTVNELLVQD